MAARGVDTLLFGPLKPVGLINPITVNSLMLLYNCNRIIVEGTLYNLVGFQTNLKWGEQRGFFIDSGS